MNSWPTICGSKTGVPLDNRWQFCGGLDFLERNFFPLCLKIAAQLEHLFRLFRPITMLAQISVSLLKSVSFFLVRTTLHYVTCCLACFICCSICYSSILFIPFFDFLFILCFVYSTHVSYLLALHMHPAYTYWRFSSSHVQSVCTFLEVSSFFFLFFLPFSHWAVERHSSK